MEETTIAAISTPQGSGGIGIVRLSGRNAVAIGEKMFRSYSGRRISQLDGYQGMLGELVKNETVLDQCIVYRYKAPASYTGEDVIEISCHGGSWVTSQVLRYTLELGAVPAGPGEFTKRAFLNGKMDLLEAEGVMDIISAQGDASLKAGNALREGVLSTRIHGIVEKILDQSAHLAAWADYPEEEMEMVDEEDLSAALHVIEKEMDQLISSYDYGKILRGGIPTAIVGKPNVGKSTLMNLLSGYDLSIVSPIPGTTRDVVREQIRLGELLLQLADTAGIRDTQDEIEQVGVQRSKAQLENAQLVLALFDYSAPLDEEDLQLLELLDDKRTIVLINKGDLDGKIQMDHLKERFSHISLVSAKESEGLDQLEEQIKSLLNLNQYNQGDTAVLTNERQRQSLIKSRSSLLQGIEALEQGVTLDAVGVCLDESLEELLALTGKTVREEVVHQVFAQFCVGK